MKKAQNGFTLVEIMIVIVIIGMILTMALPTFTDRIIRTQVKEGQNLAVFVQDNIEAFYAANERMPKDNAEAKLPPADKIVGNYVESIQVEDGAIQIEFGQKVNRYLVGQILTIRPAIVEDYPAVPIAWVQGNSMVPEGMVAQGENKTSVMERHLPFPARNIRFDKPTEPVEPDAEVAAVNSE